MATTLIFGGSGKCARHITSLLTSPPHSQTVHSIIRSPSQIPSIQSLGAQPLVQSIEETSAAEMASTIRTLKPSTIIWAAGAGGGNPERTRSVDFEGAVKSMDAAAEAGVSRYIIISAIDVRDRQKAAPEWYDDADLQRSEGVWKAIGPYMEAKFGADSELVKGNGKRGLKYTIVRPGRLLDEPAKGMIEAGKVHLSEGVSREDVAAVVVECMANPGTEGLAIDVVGGKTPIKEAIGKVVEGRVDCFEGRY